ncbi:MAG TPA: hypothetical protein DDZ89_14000 [Clostridiales bacterium]|nr:hypothetical protein [Clostridiales bacterium]
MVTIEQKLSLFSKLLHRSMEERFAEEMANLKNEYAIKIQQNKKAVDQEAEEILAKARKNADTRVNELVNKTRMNQKKEVLSVREKQFGVFMNHLKEEIESFMNTDGYRNYLCSLVSNMELAESLADTSIVLLTARDHMKHSEYLRQFILNQHQKNLNFKVASDQMIGGIIVEDPVCNVRINMSIKTLLEDRKSIIMLMLFQAIEAGDVHERQ